MSGVCTKADTFSQCVCQECAAARLLDRQRQTIETLSAECTFLRGKLEVELAKESMISQRLDALMHTAEGYKCVTVRDSIIAMAAELDPARSRRRG